MFSRGKGPIYIQTGAIKSALQANKNAYWCIIFKWKKAPIMILRWRTHSKNTGPKNVAMFWNVIVYMWVFSFNFRKSKSSTSRQQRSSKWYRVNTLGCWRKSNNNTTIVKWVCKFPALPKEEMRVKMNIINASWCELNHVWRASNLHIHTHTSWATVKTTLLIQLLFYGGRLKGKKEIIITHVKRKTR